MSISNSEIKKINGTITVFLFSIFIVGGSIMRYYIFNGKDFAESDTIIIVIFASILTIAYLFFKKKYLKNSYHEKNNLRNR